jgi:hypothetical protein
MCYNYYVDNMPGKSAPDSSLFSPFFAYSYDIFDPSGNMSIEIGFTLAPYQVQGRL